MSSSPVSSISGGVAPDLQVFENLVVVPGAPAMRVHLADGGPMWPDFDNQTTCRFWRNGRPMDRRPSPPKQHAPIRQGNFIWGGFVERSFGHLVAEHLQRLLLSVHKRPDDVCLFFACEGVRKDDLPSYFFDLCDWYGLSRDRIELVTTPARYETLRVGPQAEYLRGPSPEPYVLDLLARRAEANGLEPVSADVLYVTRQGLVEKGNGGHIGEGYLVDLLKRSGVSVIDPAVAPLREQMAHYAGAKTIVFAEGSALHGRQLLGHYPQDIHVLERRAGINLAASALSSRSDSLAYHDVSELYTTFMRTSRNGERMIEKNNTAISTFDRERLISVFRSAGVDLAPLWSDADYLASVRHEVEGWVDGNLIQRIFDGDAETQETYLGNVPDFCDKIGLPGLVPAMIERKRAELRSARVLARRAARRVVGEAPGNPVRRVARKIRGFFS